MTKNEAAADALKKAEAERQAKRRGAARLNKAMRKALAGMTPPDDLTVTQWAEAKRRLSAESAAEPGPWRTERTPYLREPMDAFTDPKVRHIVMVAASQVGKSEFLNNCIGYIIDEDPGSILFIHPTTIDAQEYSKLRIAPMLRDSPALRQKIAAPKSRDSHNTILQKAYPGGILTMCGSTEAHALASKPIRYVFGDERDRWATSAGNEGDPWDLAMARQTTFYNAKAVEVSTTTIKNASAIEAAYYTGTMERWNSKCPHCGEYHEIRWSDIRFEYDEIIVSHKKTYKVKKVYYTCPGCGCISTEAEMKRAPAKWIAENPEAYGQGTRSFWLNAFVSQWASWESIVLKYLNALGSTKKMQVVFNTCFGEPWEDRGDIEDEDSLLARREDYGKDKNGEPVELPPGVLVLTAGVDTQDDRMEYEIVGHGFFGETWGIEKGIVMGRPDDDATWNKLDEVVFDRVMRFENGVGLRVSMSFVDEGGHFTQSVRAQCNARISKKVFCIKGMPGQDKPYISPPKKQKIFVNQIAVGTCWQYQLGVDSGKEIIMDNLRVQTPGQKYCHFPKRDDYGSAYFAGLLSETKVYDPNKKQPWSWKKIPGHERNEPLDCRNYALAAFKALPKNLDEIDRQIKAASGVRVPAPPSANITPPKRRPAQRSRQKYYDDW
ncbi:phage terminase large subunit (GpA) [Firmicutes bacterium CAG:170]|jgi:phage terminase large subunit GpA-like protein|nr:phage terminase large subunit (GpA) [Firmicutes bacterium CAG:170]